MQYKIIEAYRGKDRPSYLIKEGKSMVSEWDLWFDYDSHNAMTFDWYEGMRMLNKIKAMWDKDCLMVLV